MLPCTFVGFVLLAGTVMLQSGPAQETETDKITSLIKQLGHDKFAIREAASKELLAIGEPALDALRKATATTNDPEVRLRAGRIIESISRSITTRELKKLQGTWSLIAYHADGKRVKGEDKTHVFLFKGDQWSIQIGGQLFQAGTVQRIEVKEKLNTIDLLITQGGNIGVTAESIYAIEGDSLKYLNCGNPRATEFTTKPGDGRHYLTFRRAVDTYKK